MWGSKRIPFFAYFFGGEQKRAEEEAAPPIPGKFLPILPLFKASDCPNVCKQSIESTNLAPRHLTYKDDSVTRFGEISPILQKVLSLWPMDSWFLIWQNVEPSLANLVHYWPSFHCCWRPNSNNLVTLKVEPRGPGGAFFGHCKNGTKPKFAKNIIFLFCGGAIPPFGDGSVSCDSICLRSFGQSRGRSWSSVTRLGDFWKLFTTNLLRYKSSQKRLVTFWGHFEKSFLYFSKLRDYFLGNFRNIWANFYSNIWSHWQ